MSPVFIVGDVHGQLHKLTRLLREAGLIHADLSWSGAQSELWFLGDFVDRGPDGVGVIDLVMRLQQEAESAGGRVESLLGNHEALLLAAYRFTSGPPEEHEIGFKVAWMRNGGVDQDLENLSERHIAWIVARPAMAVVKDRLLIHADADLYSDYGSSIHAVNRSVAGVLKGRDPDAWDRFLGEFSRRLEFTGPEGPDRARDVLGRFGGRQIIHGHTPIWFVTRQAPDSVREPLAYNGGLCINMDPGLFRGGRGFLYRLD